MFENPYKARIAQFPQILQEKHSIFSWKWKWNEYFENTFPITLEIGTGNGAFLSKQIARFPHINFIGFEIKYKRLYKTLQKILPFHHNNFVLIKARGEYIPMIFWKEEIDRVIILYPDPWSKKQKQKKHRLLQESFLLKLNSILKTHGTFLFKTDDTSYFDEVIALCKKYSHLWKIEEIASYNPTHYFFWEEYMTEFEKTFIRNNIPVFCMLVQKIDSFNDTNIEKEWFENVSYFPE